MSPAGPRATHPADVPLVEHRASGLAYLRLVTTLLQNARLASPTGGLWEAADLQWWWRRDQHPDPARQAFWLAARAPVAAAVVTDRGDRVGCDLLGVGSVGSTRLGLVWPRTLEMIDALGGRSVEMTVRDDDPAMAEAVMAAGFEPTEERGANLWMPARDRPAVPGVRDGFVLRSRAESQGTPHHMIPRNGERVAERLRECSLYRPELDLVIRHAETGETAAYGLFWSDPVTRVGLIEPMRTEERFQRMGLASSVLREGMDRLARLGCTRLKVGYLIGNEAARRLYLGAGFRLGPTDRTYRRAPADRDPTRD